MKHAEIVTVAFGIGFFFGYCNVQGGLALLGMMVGIDVYQRLKKMKFPTTKEDVITH